MPGPRASLRITILSRGRELYGESALRLRAMPLSTHVLYAMASLRSAIGFSQRGEYHLWAAGGGRAGSSE
jgi:hypothetical protein